ANFGEGEGRTPPSFGWLPAPAVVEGYGFGWLHVVLLCAVFVCSFSAEFSAKFSATFLVATSAYDSRVGACVWCSESVRDGVGALWGSGVGAGGVRDDGVDTEWAVGVPVALGLSDGLGP